jgi:hypothetical protein
MQNFNTLFQKQRHLEAYQKLVDARLPEALGQLQQEMEHVGFDTSIQTTLVSEYPALKVTASTLTNNADVFVVFDSTYSPYGVGIKSGYGHNNFAQAHTADDAAELVKKQLKAQISSW